MASTLRFNVRLPVLTTDADMRAHCAQFGLTLQSWEKTEHALTVNVAEDVSDEQHGQIAAALTAHLGATLVTAIPQ